jgi:hypothetical protein
LKDLIFNLQKADPNFKFDYNGIENGMMLQKKSNSLEINGHTSHKQYNDAISEKISEIIKKESNVDLPKKAFKELQDLMQSTKQKLKTEVLLGTKDVNDIVNF